MLLMLPHFHVVEDTPVELFSRLQELRDARARVREMQEGVQESRRQAGLQQDASDAAGQRERAALQRCELLTEQRDQLSSQLDLDQQHASRQQDQVQASDI